MAISTGEGSTSLLVNASFEATANTNDVGSNGLLSFANQADRAVVVDLERGFWTNAARILPLGDSNTHGFIDGVPQEQWEGYRLDLWQLATRQYQWFDYVGSSFSGPRALPDRFHHGISGITSTEVVELSTQIASTYRPDIVLLMLGTNDAVRENNAAETVPGELLTIMQKLAAEQPDVTILLAPLPPVDPTRSTYSLPNSDEIRAAINAQLPNVVSHAQALGIDATLVPMSDLTTADLTDGVHLTDAGHGKIAAAWFEALRATLSTDNGTFGGERAAVPGIVDIQGSELGDALRGNEEANVIDGRAGADILRGGAGEDNLQGGAGKDTLNGEADNDFMMGGADDDFYYVDSSLDQVTEVGGQGFDRVRASASFELEAGQEIEWLGAPRAGAIDLVGNSFGQFVIGNAFDNVLNGSGGRDRITGYGGQDTFVFDSAPGAAHFDRIADFSHADDVIHLDRAVFAIDPGALADGAFKILALGARVDADDRILFSPTSGVLIYDADGRGGVAAVAFATLVNRPDNLTADDIFVF